MKNIFVLALLVVSCGSFAKGYSPAVTARPGGYDVRYASNGTPLAVPASVLPGGAIGATGPVNVVLPGGINYPAVATAAIAAGAMLTPWGSAIGIGLALGSIGVAVLDAALADSKIRFKPGGGLEREVAVSVYTANCQGVKTGSVASIAEQCRIAVSNYWKANGYPSCNYNVTVNGDSFSLGYLTSCGGYPTITAYLQSSSADWQVSTVDQAAQIMSLRAPSVTEVQALIDLSFGPLLDLPVLTGPSSVFKGNTVQLGLDGTVTEIEERYIASFSPGVIGIGVEKKQTVTTPQKVATTITTNPDGSQSTGVTTTPRGTATVTTTAPLEQSITCGLPGTPACKLDESGTVPNAGSTYDPTKTAIDTAKASADAAIGGAASIAAPSWSFSFQLPTGCAPYVTGIKGVVLNVCQYQPTIHGLLSLIWAAATAFAMIGMVGRTIREA